MSDQPERVPRDRLVRENIELRDRADAAESALRQVREDLTALAERGYSGTQASINSAWRADIAAVLAAHGGQR
jgi:hypothetical protein